MRKKKGPFDNNTDLKGIPKEGETSPHSDPFDRLMEHFRKNKKKWEKKILNKDLPE